MYEKLYDRIKKAQLSVDYANLVFYRAYYNETELNEMINEFAYYTNKFKIECSAESETLVDQINGWRS